MLTKTTLLVTLVLFSSIQCAPDLLDVNLIASIVGKDNLSNALATNQRLQALNLGQTQTQTQTNTQTQTQQQQQTQTQTQQPTQQQQQQQTQTQTNTQNNVVPLNGGYNPYLAAVNNAVAQTYNPSAKVSNQASSQAPSQAQNPGQAGSISNPFLGQKPIYAQEIRHVNFEVDLNAVPVFHFPASMGEQKVPAYPVHEGAHWYRFKAQPVY